MFVTGKLSPAQDRALVATLADGGTHVRAASARTVAALVRRGLAEDTATGPVLTAAGRREALRALRRESARDQRANAGRDRTPTTTWTVTDADGAELARVSGQSLDEAAIAAERVPAVRAAVRRDGGFGLRRLAAWELQG